MDSGAQPAAEAVSCLEQPIERTVPRVEAEVSAEYRWSECSRIEPTPPSAQALYALDGTVLVLEQGGRVVAYTADSNAPTVLVEPPAAGGVPSWFDLTADGRGLVIGEPNGVVRVLEAATGDSMGAGSGPLVERVAIDTSTTDCDGRFVYSEAHDVLVGAGTDALCVFEADGSPRATIPLPEGTPGLGGTVLVGVASEEPPIRAHRGGTLLQFGLDGEVGDVLELTGEQTQFEPVLSRDAESLVALVPDGNGGYVAVFDTATGEVRWAAVVAEIWSNTPFVLSPDGALLVEGQGVYSLLDGALTAEATRSDWDRPEALAPGGRTALGLYYGNVREWELAGSQLLRVYGAHADDVAALTLSLDGRFLASAGRGAVAWELAPELADSVPRYNGQTGWDLALSPDGSVMIVGGDNAVFYRDDGSRWYQPPPPDLPFTMPFCYSSGWVFSPTGCVAVGTFYEVAAVFDVEQYDYTNGLGRTCNTGAAFTPDGSRLLTATMQWFDTSTWEPIIQPVASVADAFHVEFSPDGSEFVVSRAGECPSEEVGLALGLVQDCSVAERYDTDTGELLETVPWLEGGRAHYSPEGHWLLDSGRLHHSPSGATVELSADATAGVFTPAGDVILGQPDGALVQYCRDEP